MSNLIKLGIAAALAAGAVILNLWWLNSRPEAPKYIAIKKELPAGEKLKEADLIAIPIPTPKGEGATDLSQTFIPWDQRAIVLDRRTVRNFKSGEPLLYRDMEVAPPRYDVIGPFLIVSLGEEFRGEKKGEPGEITTSRSSDTSTVTVLVTQYIDKEKRLTFDNKTRRLMQLVEANTGGSGEGDKLQRVLMPAAYPELKKGAGEGETDSAPGEGLPEGAVKFRQLHVTVPIDYVTISQTVLSKGDFIGFVVPSNL